jgi:hypothetical protein
MGLAVARGWTVMVAVALLTAALWLRTPDVRYLAPASIATVLATILLASVPRALRVWGAVTVLALLTFSVLGALAQRELGRIERDWVVYRGERIARGGEGVVPACTIGTRCA